MSGVRVGHLEVVFLHVFWLPATRLDWIAQDASFSHRIYPIPALFARFSLFHLDDLYDVPLIVTSHYP